MDLDLRASLEVARNAAGVLFGDGLHNAVELLKEALVVLWRDGGGAGLDGARRASLGSVLGNGLRVGFSTRWACFSRGVGQLWARHCVV